MVARNNGERVRQFVQPGQWTVVESAPIAIEQPDPKQSIRHSARLHWSDMDSQKSNNGILWLVGGVMVLLLFGCMMTLTVSLLATRSSFSTGVGQRPAVSGTISNQTMQSLQPTPVPVVIVATPEGGIDYESAVLANVYRQVNPSVVNVTVLGSSSSLHALFGQPLTPDAPEDDGLYSFSSGSGFVWDTNGHIVTNNHVVDNADEIQVTFADGTVAVAEVVGTDVDSDLAVLRIDPTGYDIVPIRRGQMSDVFVGMRVAAIGNPFGLEGTLTSGIVSALGRSIPARTSFSIPGTIQTDTAINPGNSGGPLLNEQGELIGVNAQISSEDRANSGVGFAIPISIVERVIPDLITQGYHAHAYIGISADTYSPICAETLGLPVSARGALVQSVLPRTPASRGGLRAGSERVETPYPNICPGMRGGDLITAIDDRPVVTFDDVLVYLQNETSPDDTIQLTVLRDGETETLQLTLARRPNN